MGLSSLVSVVSMAGMPQRFRMKLVIGTYLFVWLLGSNWCLARNDLRSDAARERVHRNRTVSAAVAKIAERLRPDCDVETLRLVQLALDYEPDAFNVPEPPPRRISRQNRVQNPAEEPAPLVSVHDSVESLLSKSGKELLNRYEGQFGAEATAVLVEARNAESVAGIRRVCRRFFLTAAGYAASEELVIRWLDAGEYGLASRLASQVLAEPVHHDRITTRFREIASQLAVIGRLAGSGIPGAPDRQADVKFQRQFSRNLQSMQLFESGWMTVGGNSSGSRLIQGTSPVVAPLWKADYFQGDVPRYIDEYLREWEGAQKVVDQPSSPATYPIVVGGRVIFRDAAGVRCTNAVDGKAEWSFPCRHNLISEVRERNNVFSRRRLPSGMNHANQLPVATNSLMGTISSDGHLVFAVDEISHGSETDTELLDIPGLFNHYRNRLLALQVGTSDPKGHLVWANEGTIHHEASTSGRPSIDAAKRNAPGQARNLNFLGPPLPGTTELLCMTEVEDEIHLTALAPRTGAILWTQPLCVLERSEQLDPERRETACIPSRSGGIVVCPTNTGLLVAVDQARAKLMWAAYVDDVVDRNLPQSRGGTKATAYNYGGFLPYCQIARDCVVYLSSRSNELFCLDLMTGRVLWKVSRGDAEFVGAVVSGRVLIVGRQGCRCYSLDDGRELWTNTVASPVGCGLPVGSHYVLPLETGRVACVDLETGRDDGTSILRSDISLGHLAGDGDCIYSLSQRGIVAFPQVHHSLSRLGTVKGVQLSQRQQDIVRAAAALVPGNPAEAELRLKSSLNGDLPRIDRDRARRDLKGLLFEKIGRVSDLQVADCDALDQLLDAPAEQFAFLVAMAQKDRQVRGRQSVDQLVRRIYQLPGNVTCTSPDDEQLTISPTVWCRMQSATNSSVEFSRFLADLTSNRDTLPPNSALPETLPGETAPHDIEDMQRFVRVFGHLPSADIVRARLASQMEAEQSTHFAETLWLRNEKSAKSQVAAEAAMHLVDLWEKVGFLNDATRQLETLRTKYGQTLLPGGLTGVEYVRRMDPDRLVKQAWRQTREPDWPVDQVAIRQKPIPLGQIPLSVGPNIKKNAIRFSSERGPMALQGATKVVPGQPCEFVVPTGEFGEPKFISVFDQRTMFLMGSFKVPSEPNFPFYDRSLSGSHFMLLGIRGGALGISTVQLADAAPVWAQLPVDLEGLQVQATPGPWGPEFASFTWRNRLYVVDPVDGTLLWQRTFPATSRESSSNQRFEVIGDGQALAIQSIEKNNQGSDRVVTFDMFETSTGRRLPQARVAFDVRGSVGRHVFGPSDTANGHRLQIRDLLKEVSDIDLAVEDPVRREIPPMSGGEIAYIAANEIMVFDVVQCQKKLSVKLDDSEANGVNNFRVMSDDFRYFVNLGRATPTVSPRHLNQPIRETSIPNMMIKDDLYAFDRATGEMLWKRSIPSRTVLQFPDCHVPFLVTISEVKDNISNSPQNLTIEIIDSTTGVTIGYRENLAYDRLQAAQYDGVTGRIRLIGQSTDIELSFGPGRAQMIDEQNAKP